MAKNNDSVIGGILVAIGGISLIAEIIFLIVKPLKDGAPFELWTNRSIPASELSHESIFEKSIESFRIKDNK